MPEATTAATVVAAAYKELRDEDKYYNTDRGSGWTRARGHMEPISWRQSVNADVRW